MTDDVGDGRRPVASGRRRRAHRRTSSPSRPARCARRSPSGRPTADRRHRAVAWPDGTARARSVWSRTLAPAATSAGWVCSAMLCESPSTLGVKIIAVGQTPGQHLGVVAGAARHPPRRVAEPLRPSPRRGRPSPGRSRPARTGPASGVVDRDALGARPTRRRTSASARLGLAAARRRRCCAGRRSASPPPATTLTRSGCTSSRPTVATCAPPMLERVRRAHERGDRGGDVPGVVAQRASASCRRGPTGR